MGGTPSSMVRAITAELQRLRQECEALRKDAGRYRTTRRKVCIVGGPPRFHILNVEPTYVAPDAAIEFDAAIDAEIARERS